MEVMIELLVEEIKADNLKGERRDLYCEECPNLDHLCIDPHVSYQ